MSTREGTDLRWQGWAVWASGEGGPGLQSWQGSSGSSLGPGHGALAVALTHREGLNLLILLPFLASRWKSGLGKQSPTPTS